MIMDIENFVLEQVDLRRHHNGFDFLASMDELKSLCVMYHQAKCNEEPQTLRASLSANEQDAIDAERYRYLKENYVMANFNIYDDEDFSNGQTGLIIEVPNGIDINRDLDLVVDQAISNKKQGGCDE
jgi:hypothetical protein